MRILFAVSNDNITTSVVNKYQQKFKEIITSKNVYYFNAIIKELQRNKSYDAIVIGEDLEPISNNNYEAVDKFLFEKLDGISDEASKPTGEDIPIILICSDRRTKSDQLLIKLFGIGIYNAIIGNDRSIDTVCNLINKPRNKKEAKVYYKVESEEVTPYERGNDQDVSETELQNILAHYRKIGLNEKKCVESFDSIADQYNETQLRIIVNFLPNEVKQILENNSSRYQKLMSKGTVLSNGTYAPYNKQNPKKPGKLDLLTKDLQKTNLSKPVIIPSTININRNIQSPMPTQNNVQPQQQINQRQVQPTMPQVNRQTQPVIPQTNRPVQQAMTPQTNRPIQPMVTQTNQQPMMQQNNMPMNQTPSVLEKQEQNTQSNTQNINLNQGVNREKMEPLNSNNNVPNNNTLNNMMPNNNTLNNSMPNSNVNVPNNNISMNTNNMVNQGEQVTTPDLEQKRGRGRPRKAVVTPVNNLNNSNGIEMQKRGRGRPRKTVVTPNTTNEDNQNEFAQFNPTEQQGSTIMEPTPVEPLPVDSAPVEQANTNSMDNNSMFDDILPGLEEPEEQAVDLFSMEPIEETNTQQKNENEMGDSFLPGFENDIENLNTDSNTNTNMNDANTNLFDLDIEESQMPVEQPKELEQPVQPTQQMQPEPIEQPMNSIPENNPFDNPFESSFTPEPISPVEPQAQDTFNANMTQNSYFANPTSIESTPYSTNTNMESNPYSTNTNMNNQNIYDQNPTQNLNQNQDYYNMQNNTSMFNGQDNANMFNAQDDINNLISTQSMPNVNTNNVIAGNGKIVAFVGTTKNGTSFIVNNLAQLLSQSGVRTAILDLTKNKNSYYMFTDNDANLMKKATDSIKNLSNGTLDGLNVNKNLTLFTSLPDGMEEQNKDVMLQTLSNNFDIALLDCDFSTDTEYFVKANEIYLIQSMDTFTIQPLTQFLSDLKLKNALDESKLRVIINKYVRLKKLNEKMIIGGMSKYNEPSMTLQRDLFNAQTIKYVCIPFEMDTYARYLESIAMCNLSLNGYSQNFINALQELKNMVYPLISGGYSNGNTNQVTDEKHGLFGGKKNKNVQTQTTQFSNNVNDTLNRMRTNNF